MKTIKLSLQEILELVDAINAGTDLPEVDVSARTRSIQRYLSYYQRQAGRLANRLANGEITVSQWRSQMRTELYNLHYTMYVIGIGGTRDMTAQDVEAVQAVVDEQMQYLDNWANQMETEGVPSEARLQARANLYGGAGNATEQYAQMTKDGLPRMPFYPGDGTTLCMTNCRCKWRWRTIDRERGDYNVTWVMGSVEHCDTCIARARTANPLRVRGGVIQDAEKFMRASLYR